MIYYILCHFFTKIKNDIAANIYFNFSGSHEQILYFVFVSQDAKGNIYRFIERIKKLVRRKQFEKTSAALLVALATVHISSCHFEKLGYGCKFTNNLYINGICEFM